MREHRCIYLENKDGKALWCWQKGAKVSKAECTRCLLAYCVGGLYSNPVHKLCAGKRGEK